MVTDFSGGLLMPLFWVAFPFQGSFGAVLKNWKGQEIPVEASVVVSSAQVPASVVRVAQ